MSEEVVSTKMSLDVDITTVEIRPVVTEPRAVVKITKVEGKRNKNNDGRHVVLYMTAQEPLTSTRGNKVAAATFIDRVSIDVVGKLTLNQIAESIAKLQDAFLGERVPLKDFEFDMLVGKTAIALIGTEEYEGNQQNRVKGYLPSN